MGRPVSLKNHKHLCPGMKVPPTPPIPHIGGMIIKTKQKFVKVAGTPVACVKDQTLCMPVAKKGKVKKGSKICRIKGKKIARMGDTCAHMGKLVQGTFWLTSD